ncbi:hypothetical protein M436DRAFT_67748 [Aureobasidium namibiae CBS 147.97]|uniref:F-box domain-containing protein n=1 Tax=Aureobasidium namibiae CBS 147.97 TaxID=1043004 RepID=A0A074WB61_9PEZI|nr:uncharacterized protein M436DRAFT_67748 [Aureobasidium namibiae CBS 147.97]KEQ68829.1 hypothetical protein M436DRAFT_67748 [Aureobasidium namibiae CBS 147.97]
MPQASIASNSNSAEKSNTGQKTEFLDLPLELRAMIYNHALAVDNDTYEVAHIACSYRLLKLPDHFALLTVNHQVANEVKANVTARSFKFTSTYALDNFLFCEKHEVLHLMMANFNVLCKASRIVVVVGKRPFSRAVRDHCVQVYDTMTELLSKLLDFEFVDAGNSDQRIMLATLNNIDLGSQIVTVLPSRRMQVPPTRLVSSTFRLKFAAKSTTKSSSLTTTRTRSRLNHRHAGPAKGKSIVVGMRPHSRRVRRHWDQIRYTPAELLPESPGIELVDNEGNDVGVKRPKTTEVVRQEADRYCEVDEDTGVILSYSFESVIIATLRRTSSEPERRSKKSGQIRGRALQTSGTRCMRSQSKELLEKNTQAEDETIEQGKDEQIIQDEEDTMQDRRTEERRAMPTRPVSRRNHMTSLSGVLLLFTSIEWDSRADVVNKTSHDFSGWLVHGSLNHIIDSRDLLDADFAGQLNEVSGSYDVHIRSKDSQGGQNEPRDMSGEGWLSEESYSSVMQSAGVKLFSEEVRIVVQVKYAAHGIIGSGSA